MRYYGGPEKGVGVHWRRSELAAKFFRGKFAKIRRGDDSDITVLLVARAMVNRQSDQKGKMARTETVRREEERRGKGEDRREKRREKREEKTEERREDRREEQEMSLEVKV